MTTKDIWSSLNSADKFKQVEDTLTQLHTIQTNTHPLSGTKEQGRLANVKKDLETFLVNVASWEPGKRPEATKFNQQR